MAFTDPLPTGLEVAAMPGISNNCGGTFAAIAGTTTLTFAEGMLAAGAACEIRVMVRATGAGTLTNPAIDLTSSIATATSAAATLTVVAAEAPDFAKVFSPATVDPGEISTLTFTIDNSDNALEVGSLAFDDSFPDGLVVADPPNVMTTCGGALAPAAGATSLAFSGGTVAAGATCMLAVSVQALRAGTLENTPGELISDLPVTTPGATATLMVNEAPLSVSMSFGPSAIEQGGVSTLTYTLDNSATVAATSVSLSDTLPTEIVVASIPNASTTCSGGTVEALVGGSTITYSGGTVDASRTCMIMVDVTSAVAGSHANSTETVTSLLGTSATATAMLTVNAAGAPGFARIFSPATIDQGEETEIVFTVDNGDNAIEMTGMAFDDRLPPGVSVADPPGAGNNCGGTFAAPAGATTLAFTGGALAAGATCEIRVTVRAIEAGTQTGPEVDLVSSIATATSAEATLVVDPAEAPGFAKVFTPATVNPGEISRLTFTIDNTANALEVESLAFDDDFPNGLIVADSPNASTTCVGGTVVAPARGIRISFSDGTIAAGGTCTIAVDVQALRSGTLANRSGNLTSDLPVTTPGAAATLMVNEAPLSVSMSFGPSAISQGGVSTLTYDLGNGAAVGASEISLSDMLPVEIVVASTPNASTSCTGGTLTAVAGDDTITYIDGTVDAGGACMITVAVTSRAVGSHVNSTGTVTSSLGTSTTAEATLTVNAAGAPGFAKVFAPATIDQGEETEMVFHIDNSGNAIEVMAMAFTDPLPAGLEVAAVPGISNSCGGTFAAPAGATTLALMDGALAAGATCEIRVTIRAIGAGTLTNPAINLTSSIATATSAVTTLTVAAADAPGFAKVFAPATVNPGGISTLTFTIDNSDNQIAVGELAFDDFFPSGLVVADIPNASMTCAGGTLEATAGGSTITYSGGAVDPTTDCTVSVDVQALRSGMLANVSGELTSDLPVNTPGAAATLMVNEAPLSVSMAFGSSAIEQGGVSTLTYDLNNSATVEALEVFLSDTLPTGVLVASEPNAVTSCDGGALTAAAGGISVEYSGGSVAATGTCTITVDVTSRAVGSHVNSTETVTSSLGTSTIAEATLTVNAAGAPGFAKVFAPATIDQGEETEMVFHIDNSGNAIEVMAMAFTDPLPAGLEVAAVPGISNSCGGTFAAPAGATTLALTDGALAAGATCEIRVTVRAIGAGTLTNPAINLTSSIATATSAVTTLTVAAADAPGFVKVFAPATVNPGGVSTLTFTIDNSDNALEVGSLAFDDDFPDGLIVADPPNAETTCVGTLEATAGGNVITYSGGRVAAGVTCTISVDVQALRSGMLENMSGELTSDLPVTTPGAEATLAVNEAPLSVSMSFDPEAIDQGGISRLTYGLNNSATVEASEVFLSDTLPAGVLLAPEPNAVTNCDGGTLTAAVGGTSVEYSGGRIVARTTCMIAVDVTSRAVDSHANSTETVASSLGTSAAATAMLMVNAAGAPGFFKVFSPMMVDQGEKTEIVFRIDNSGNAIEVMTLAFTDLLPAGLEVAAVPGISNSCGGTFTATAGTTTLTFAEGMLAAGAACEIRVMVRATGAGTLINPAIDLTSSIALATAAAATLTVNAASAPGFAKAFSPATVNPGGLSTLTFTIDNSDNALKVGSLAFDDDFPDGLIVADPPNAETTCVGTLEATAGGSTITYSGGAVDPITDCTVSVDVQALRSGTLANMSGELTSDLPVNTPGAAATLMVNEAPLSVSMAFGPSAIEQGGVSTLTYDLGNGAEVAAMSIVLSDTLPAGILVATEPDASTTCTGGTLMVAAGGTSVEYSGGGVAAGTTCTIAVDVTSRAVGSHANSTETVTSSLGTSAAVSATLMVDAADAPIFTKAFSPATVDQGEETEVVFRIDNSGNAIEVMTLAFTDPLPTGLEVAAMPGISNNCGGTFAAIAGTTALTFTEGMLAAGAACEIRVMVRATGAGTLTNPAIDLTSSIATATSATTTLTVNAAEAPDFAKVFSPTTVDPGGISTLTFIIDNSDNALEVGSLAFDDSFPDGLVVADPPNVMTTCGGALAPAAGATSLAFSGGTVAAGATCMLAVSVQALRAGTLENTPGELISDLPVTTPGATATLTVNEAPLSVSMSFGPSAIEQGGVSTLTYTLDNSATVAATSVVLSDMLPTEIVVASIPNASATCSGGTVEAPVGGSTITYSGGTVDASRTCMIMVDVTSAVAGSHANSTETVTSLLGTSATAEAMLTVNAAGAPGFARIFSPATIDQGEETEIVFTVDNGDNAIEMTGMAFDDRLPSGVSVADPPGAGNNCGGTFTAPVGATTLALTGGALAAGATCEIRVTVRAIEAGTQTGPEVDLMSNIATATSAAATLTVVAAGAPGFAKVFAPATVDPGGVSTLTFTIDNSDNALEVGSLAFDDSFPDSLVVANPPNAATTCGGAFAPAAGATSLVFSGGRIAAGVTCTVAVEVQALRSGTLANRSENLTSDLPVTTPGAAAALMVNEAPLSVSMSFDPVMIDQGGVSTLTYGLGNGAAVGASEISLSDMLPVEIVVASTPNASTSCTGGTLTAVAGDDTITYIDGTVDAGGACMITVAVTSRAVGSHVNSTGTVTSSLGTSTTAEATLTVNAAGAPVFTKAFSPATVAPGEISRLTFTIDNTDNQIAVGELTFADTFPDGLVVAGTPNASMTCAGGTLEATAGGSTITYSGGAVDPTTDCTVSVDVQALRSGTLANRSGELTSDLPVNTPGAAATLMVNEAPLSVSMSFDPVMIDQGGVSTLTYDLGNGAAVGASEISLSDMLPAEIVVAPSPNALTTCTDGTLTVAADGTSVEYSGGRIAAGTICTITIDVTSRAVGSHVNSTGTVTSSLGTSTAAEATLTVNAAGAPGFAKAFSPMTIDQGEETEMVFHIDNTGNAIEVTTMAFIDPLPAGLEVASVPGISNSCGGTFVAPAGGTTLIFEEGTLVEGATCEIRVTVRATGAGTLTNPAIDLTSSIATATSAATMLMVVAADAPGFAKAFSPTTIAPGGVSTLTFTIDNTDNQIDVGALTFADSFPDGLIVADPPKASTTCDGTFTPTASAASLAFTSGHVAAGRTCMLAVDVQALRAGTLESRSGELTSDLPVTTPGAAATLMVNEAPLAVSTSFDPATIDQGGVSALTYGLNNNAAVTATSISLSDTLPAEIVVASSPNASTTCSGGTLAAPADGSTIAYSDGTLGSNANCTITVAVTSAVSGMHLNSTESVTSSLGTSASASATLVVDAAGAPGFAKAFSPTTVDPGGVSTLTFTIDNTDNQIAVGTLSFVDDFPDGLVVADPPNAETTCTGTVVASAGSNRFTHTGGTVDAGRTCTIAVDVQALHSGALANRSGVLTSDLPVTTPGAAATLMVNEAPLSISMAFGPSEIDQGGVSTLIYGLDNNAAVTATSISLSDMLPTEIVVASIPNAQTTCTGGTLMAMAGGDRITFTDGTLAAGETCTIAIDVTSTVAGSYPNSTESVISSLGTSAPAQATLTVDAAEAPGFAKAFSPSTVDPGGVSTLTFTIDNTDNQIAVGTLRFVDDLPDGLAVAPEPDASTTCAGGTVSATAGGTSVGYSDGRVAAGATCTVSVDVQALRSGPLANRSSELTSDLPVTTPGAAATLTVNEQPLSVSMSFGPSAINQGGVSMLTYGLGNGAAVLATSVALSDTLPTNVVVAPSPNALTTCTGGTLAVVAGGTSVEYSGGRVAAGTTCTITVDVISAVSGRYANSTETVTSSLGTSAAAEAMLTVNAAGAPGFARIFSPTMIDQGGATEIVFTVDNGANTIGMTGMSFDDRLPSGVSVADPSGIGNSCGGTFAAPAGATTLMFTGGALAAGATCEIRVTVRAIEAGTRIGPEVDLTSSIVTATSAEATLIVDPAEAPGFAKVFAPATVDPGGISMLTFTIDNTDNQIDIGALTFVDSFPDGMIVADTPNASTTCSGVFAPAAGATSLAFSDGTVAAGETCTLAVEVQILRSGTLTNRSGELISDLPVTTPGAEATLTVNEQPLSVSMSFDPATIDQGGVSTLTYGLDNGAVVGASEVFLSDMLPAEIVVASTPNASTTCIGGTLTAAASGTSFEYSGGRVATGTTCTITVDVTSRAVGSHANIAETVISSLGTSTVTSATLMVDAANAPIFTKAFSPATIDQGEETEIVFRIDNLGNAIEVTELAFTDPLPVGLEVATMPGISNNCGGTFAVVAGDTTLIFAEGTLVEGAVCEIRVTVRATGAGTLTNPAIDLTSSIASATSAEATLEVNAADAPVFTKAFSPVTVDPGDLSTLTFTINNTANALEVGSLAFGDDFPDGLVVADLPNASTTCGGAFAPAAGATSLAFSDGIVAAGATCTLAVEVQALRSGMLANRSSELTSNLPVTTPGASATLMVNEAPLSVSMSFDPATIDQGGVSTLTYGLDNGTIVAATSVVLSDMLPAEIVVASTPNAATTCPAGTVAAPTGGREITYSGGTVDAGESCMITVAVTSRAVGSHANRTESVTSALGTSAAAEATLTVDAADAPGFTKAFSPATVAPGEISRLTFTIDNSDNQIAVGELTFTDSFPDGLVVADPPNVMTTCGGALAPAAGTTSLAFSGGTVATGATCTVSVDVRAVISGPLMNTSGELSSDLPVTTPGASATLMVNEVPLSVSMSFGPSAINQGGVSRLTYGLGNSAVVAATSVVLSDTLPAEIVVAPSPNASTTCAGGTLTVATDGTSIEYSGGRVDAETTCTITVDVISAVSGRYANSTETVTSSLGTSAAAEAMLTVNAAGAPNFAKAFSPATVAPGGLSTLTFTIDNSNNQIAVGDLTFADSFPDGMIVAGIPNASTTCGGRFAPAAGDTSLAFSGGRVASGGTCTLAVEVQALRSGALTNTADDLTSDLSVTTLGASATLMVHEAPLSVSMAFGPSAIDQGGVSRLTYGLGNSAAVAAMSISLSDTLPAGILVSSEPNASTTCIGGTLTAAAGDDTITYIGGSLASGGNCMIAVDVTSRAVDSHANGTESVTSSLGTSTVASATLMVEAADAPIFTKAFSPTTINQGEEAEIVFRIDNTGNAIEVTTMAFTDPLPAGLEVAAVPGISNNCGGTFAAIAGTTTLTFAEGMLAAGAACEIRVMARAIEAGTLTNPAIDLTSSIATATGTAAMLTVVAADALGFTKVFSPTTIDPGGLSTLTFTINNSDNALEVGSLTFDDSFPDGLVVAGTPNAETTCPGGTVSAAASGTSVGYSGGRVAAGTVCTVSVDVQALRSGMLENRSGELTSDLPVTTLGAAATLMVNEASLSVSMSFEPSAISQGGVSTLTYGLGNRVAVEASEVFLSDTLPVGVLVASEPDASTTCTGGTLTVAAGGTSVEYSGGSVAAGTTCTIAVDVTSRAVDSHVNSTESVTSSLGTSTAASAMLTVNAAGAPDFAKVFSPATIDQGEETEIVFRIDNSGNAIEMTGMAFDDRLPSGVSVADPPGASNNCGGTFAAPAGATTLALTGGALAAGATCEIRVTVRAIEAGTQTGPEVDLMSNIATATSAAATLTVVAAGAPGFAKVFAPATVDPGGVSTLTFTIDNSDNALEVGSLAFDDSFPDGLVVANPPNAATTCGGAFAPAAGATSLVFSGGRIAAGVTCTVAVEVQALRSGTLANRSGELTSDLPVTTLGAAATLMVNEASLSVSMSFEPSAISQGGVSTLTYGLGNRVAVEASEVFLSDTLPVGVLVASEPDASTTCTGGTLTVAAGGTSVEYSGGSVAAGTTCTIAVDVTSRAVDSHVNSTESVTSSLGTSTAASAMLTVNAAGAPGFAKAFSPSTVNPGEISTLTFTIDNSDNQIAVGELAFTDSFPDGLIMAGTPNASTTCPGGTVVAPAGGSRISYSDGTIVTGGTCTIAVEVQALRSGMLANRSGELTSDLPVTTPGAEATLTVTERALSVSIAFDPAAIEQGGVSTLTYGLGNGALVGASEVFLSDTLPADVRVASEPNAVTDCVGGMLTAAAGGDTITYTGGRVVAETTCMITVDVTSRAVGSHVNSTGTVTSSLGTSTAAEATLTVNAAGAPGFAKAFSPATIDPGGISMLTFTIDNTANAIEVGSLAFDDDFPDGLIVADPPNASTTCPGTVVAPAGGGRISHSDGTIAAGGTCTIAVEVQALRSGMLANRSGELTSDLSVTTPGAEAMLTVNEQLLSVSMSFNPATIDQGGVSTLTYDLSNGAVVGASEVFLSDTFPADVRVASEPNAVTGCAGGTLTAAAGGTSIGYSGGRVAAGTTCTIAVDVTSRAVGSHANSTETVASSLGTSAATEATLTVNAADAPGFAKVFSPAMIDQGEETEIVFRIDNSGNAIEVTELAFTDPLPVGLEVAAVPGISNNCGGTFAATDTTLIFAEGMLVEGAVCEIRVTVRATGAGTLTNSAIDLTSSIATTTSAEATLIVDPADAPGFAKVFAPDSVAPGEISRLIFTIDNSVNEIAVGMLSFVDDFPDGMIVASEPDVSTTCAGTVVAPAGGSRISHSDGTVVAGGTCTIAVDVLGLRAGTLQSMSGDLTSDLPVTTPGASATLTVNEAPLSVSMSFRPSEIDQGDVSTLTYGLGNGAAVGASEVALSDTLPAEIVVASIPNAQTTCTGGTVGATAGGNTITYTGGTVGAGGACTITVDVTSAIPGSYLNDMVGVTSSLGASDAAEATLIVNPADAPVFTKAFSPATVDPGGVSTLTFTIDNTANRIAVGTLSFVDDFPEGLVVAAQPNVSTTCGGTVVAPTGGRRFTHTGGTVDAGRTCTIAVDVQALRSGMLENTSGELSSDLPVTTPGAEATLTVNEVPLSVTVMFDPEMIDQGGMSILTYSLGNNATITATSISLSDALPAEIVVASIPNASTTCTGGTLEALAGSSTITFTDGTLAVGETCTITIDVTSAVAGTHENSTETVTSSLGTSAPAQATLTVDAAEAPGLCQGILAGDGGSGRGLDADLHD